VYVKCADDSRDDLASDNFNAVVKTCFSASVTISLSDKNYYWHTRYFLELIKRDSSWKIIWASENLEVLLNILRLLALLAK
jgi:hypothetical protein